MPSIGALRLRIPVRHPTLINLDLPQTSLVGFTGQRKRLLTCTQETTRAKIERLCLARPIQHDPKVTIRHAKALGKAKVLMSLLAPIKYY
jgi:hypothetical protein